MTKRAIGIFNGNSRHAQYAREINAQIDSEREIFLLDFGDALNELKSLDSGWEEWYDNRPEQKLRELYPLIVERVKMLKALQVEAVEVDLDHIPPKPLKEMTPEEQKEWFENVEPVEVGND